MEIVYKGIGEIRPYENNPRKNDGAVDAVADSIREFGWKVPVVIDKDGVIVAGHTRYKAAQSVRRVRCAECKYYGRDDDGYNCLCLLHTKKGQKVYVGDDDTCGDGAR